MYGSPTRRQLTDRSPTQYAWAGRCFRKRPALALFKWNMMALWNGIAVPAPMRPSFLSKCSWQRSKRRSAALRDRLWSAPCGAALYGTYHGHEKTGQERYVLIQLLCPGLLIFYCADAIISHAGSRPPFCGAGGVFRKAKQALRSHERRGSYAGQAK